MSTADRKSAASGGIGFNGLLTIVFVVLKLTHVIAWSWWWVLAPSWIPVAIAAAVLLGAFLWVTVTDR